MLIQPYCNQEYFVNINQIFTLDSLSENQWLEVKEAVFKRIDRISCLIHYMVCSAAEGEGFSCYNLFQSKMGDFHGPIRGRNHRKKDYGAKFYGVFEGKHVTVFMNPKSNSFPAFMIEFKHPDRAWLEKLNSAIPGMRVSSVELAIDFHFSDPRLANDLLMILAKQIYFPLKRSTIKVSTAENQNTCLTLTDSKDNVIRMYTRGEDEQKKYNGKHPYYDFKNSIRVRNEFKFKCHGERQDEFKRHGIYCLEDFIPNFSFERFLIKQHHNSNSDKNKYEFRKLRHWHQQRAFLMATDNNGLPLLFQNEYYKNKNKSKWSVLDATLEKLNIKIISAMNRFDTKWKH